MMLPLIWISASFWANTKQQAEDVKNMNTNNQENNKNRKHPSYHSGTALSFAVKKTQFQSVFFSPNRYNACSMRGSFEL